MKDPFGNVLLILDRTGETAAAANSHGFRPGQNPFPASTVIVEDAKPAGALFAGFESPVKVDRAALTRAYEAIGRTADDLPYTPHFETLFRDYLSALPGPEADAGRNVAAPVEPAQGGQAPQAGRGPQAGRRR